jgi:hypothetical protein
MDKIVFEVTFKRVYVITEEEVNEICTEEDFAECGNDDRVYVKAGKAYDIALKLLKDEFEDRSDSWKIDRFLEGNVEILEE